MTTINYLIERVAHAADPAANSSLINPSTLVAMIAAAAAITGAYLTYRSSSRANATNDRKVDMDEFKEAQAWYKERLAEADRHIERIRLQLDRVNEQLAREQDVSNVLRNEVRALQGQVDLLERTMARSERSMPGRTTRGTDWAAMRPESD